MYSNSEIVENIRKECERKRTSLTKLEEKFGWGNGTIGKWKNSKRIPLDKLISIAEELNCPLYQLTGEKEKAPAPGDEREIGFDDFTYAMHNESEDLTDDDKAWLLSMARRIAEDNRKRNQKPD